MMRIKSILASIAILTSVNMMAAERGIIKVNNHQESGYSIISVVNGDMKYNNLEMVCNETGQTLLNERITKKPTYQKLVDLNELEDGNYTIQLRGKDEFVQEEFNLLYGRIKNKELAEDIFEQTDQAKFFLNEDNSNLTISHINFEENPIIFKLVNLDRQREVESVKEGRKIAYSKRYDTNYLRSGNYRATLISGNKSYHFDFTL